MKRLLAVLLSATLFIGVVLVFPSEAAVVISGVCGADGDNVTWILDDEGTLTISGTGAMKDYSDENNPPWYDNCDSITSAVITSGVTAIGDYSFICCSLSSATIPNGVTRIGDYAFDGCQRLSDVNIPNSVTSIGNRAFSRCFQLKSITIPSGVISVGENAFSSCWALKNIDIENGVQIIGTGAFSECENLTDVTIPNSVTSIGSGVFGKCVNLSSVILPDKVTSFGSGVFNHCRMLTSVKIPNGVVIIGNGTCFGCGSLTSVTIPNSVNEIMEEAFQGCSELKDVYYDGSQAQWDAIVIRELNNMLTNAALHLGNNLPVILTQPVNTTIQSGERAYFSVKAEGSGLSYQWQYSADNGVTWKNSTAAEANQADFSIAGTAANVKLLYRCAVKNDAGTVYTNNVRATIRGADTASAFALIAREPENGYIEIGINALNCTGLTSWECDLYYDTDDLTIVKQLSDRIDYASTGKDANAVNQYSGNGFAWSDSLTAPGQLHFNGYFYDYLWDAETFVQKAQKEDVYSSVNAAFFECAVFRFRINDGAKPETTLHLEGSTTGVSAAMGSATVSLVRNCSHSFGEWEITTEATCTEDGVKQRVCTICKATETEAIATAGHQLTKTDAKAATCIEEGNTEYYTCSVCKKTFSDEKATKEIDDVALPALGHSYGAWARLDDDRHQRVCANDASHIEKADHTWDDGTETKAATLEEEGETTFICTVCGAIKTEPIEKLQPVEIRDKTTDVSVSFAPETFDKDVELKVQEVGGSTVVLTDQYQSMKVYDIAAYLGGEKIQPNAPVTVRIPVPQGFDAAAIAVFHIGDDGKQEQLEITIENGVIVFTVNSFSRFFVVDTATKANFIPGDVDGNGKVESSDARLALRAAVRLSNEPTDVTEGTAGYKAADYDKNGKVESSDARCILRVTVKLDPFG